MSKIKCTVCGECYGLDNIKVIGRRDDMWFLNVLCTSCHNQALVAAAVRQEKPSRPVTDLTVRERAKFIRAGVVSPDDMLDMHSFLKDFDGDFTGLFARR